MLFWRQHSRPDPLELLPPVYDRGLADSRGQTVGVSQN